MKTDTLFYDLFRVFPATFFEIIRQNAEAAEGYRFSSVEVKQAAYRLDGVFWPPETPDDQPLYFTEVQFQSYPDFYWRLFAAIPLYLAQVKPDRYWRVVALFASRSLDPGVPKTHQHEADGHLTIKYLDEMEWDEDPSPGTGILELIVAPEAEAIQSGKELVRRLQEEPRSDATNQEIIKMVETVLVYKFPKMSRKEIQAMFIVDDIRESRVYQEAHEEGKLEGKLEGKREGELKGKLATVPLLMQAGFSVEQIAREFGVDVDVVRKVAG